MTIRNDVVRMLTMSSNVTCPFLTTQSRMNSEINVNRTRSTAHGEYGATVLHEK